MRTKRQLSIEQQGVLFAPDLANIEQEQKKKMYFFKRLVYDRMTKIVIERVTDIEVKSALLRELESILQMKNDIPDLSPMQKIIKLRDLPPPTQKNKLSEEELLQLVAEQHTKDPDFLYKLGNTLTFN